ncbi:MAG: winged helix-turn-helix domain-containing protein [Verrucomicrobiota bacterium]
MADDSRPKSLAEIGPLLAERPQWGFLSNHTHVLVCLYLDPDMRLSEISARVGLTLRIVQRIVKELTDEGVVTIEKVGRRNRYTINKTYPFRHPLEQHCNIGQLLELVAEK